MFDQVDFLNADCRVCLDKSSHQYGWIFMKDKDGKWFSAGVLSKSSIDKIIEAAKAKVNPGGSNSGITYTYSYNYDPDSLNDI